MIQLSQNFSLTELTKTSNGSLLAINQEEAQNNIGILQNLTDLAHNILQPIRDYYGVPLTVSSGYRCKALNIAVGGSQTSQHSYGEAADISVQGKTADQLFNEIKTGKVVNLDNVGQVILEKIDGKEWVHISLKTARYMNILEERYGSTSTVFLSTTDGKIYERIA